MAMLTVGFANAKESETDVRFAEVHNYFHKNNAPMPQTPLITTQKEFDSLFGVAAYMGKNGQPTKLNFKKQAVVAIVLPVTNKATAISNVRLKSQDKNRLMLSYEVHEGIARSYSTQPVYLMSIDRKWKKAQIDVKSIYIKDVETTETVWKHKNFTDKANRIRLYIDYPADSSTSLARSIDRYLSEQLAAANACFIESANSAKPSGNASNGNCEQTIKRFEAELTNNIYAYNQEYQLQDRSCSVDLQFTRCEETPRYVTVTTSGYLYSGGAHGSSIERGATFNMSTGRKAKLVNATEALRKLITGKLPKEMTNYDEAHPAPMPECPAYISNGKVVFVYQDSEIAAHAVGILRCEFYPYELQDFLTDEGKALTSYE